MTELLSRIKQFCELVEPASAIEECVYSSTVLPRDYLSVINAANGFVTSRGYFRFFGFDSRAGARSIQSWNRSPWKSEYGALSKNLIFVAEDIFGDQYGYLAVGPSAKFVKFEVEGGRISHIRTDLLGFVLTSVLISEPTAFDHTLADLAFDKMLRPRYDEHLAFALPLIAGGEYALPNVTIEPALLHLSVLGQMSVKNRSTADGTPIRKFTSR